MKKELRRRLYSAYAIPLPQRKNEFLSNLNYPKTRWRDFVISQLMFIKKKVWFSSILLFLVAILFETKMHQGDIRLLWVISALIPFFVVICITEIARSAVFGMEEIEMTTRYNLKNLLIVRMSILGTGNIILLFAAIPLLSLKVNIEMLKVIVYLLVPYLLTCLLSLIFINMIRNREIPFYLAGTAMIVSIFGLLFNSLQSALYAEKNFTFWVAVLTFLIIALSRALYKLMKNVEELQCNLFLTA